MVAPLSARLREACLQGPRHLSRSPAPYPGEGGLTPYWSPGRQHPPRSSPRVLLLPAAPGEKGGLADQPNRGAQGRGCQVCRRALSVSARRPGSALRAMAEGNQDHLSPPSPGLEPPHPPSRPPREEEAQPAFAGEAGLAGAWPSLDPRSPALRLRPSAAASLQPRSLPPSFPWVPRPTSAHPPRYPSPLLFPPSLPPATPLLCAPGSGAGPVTSNTVWRRRDWPARAIKRATSSFPITHCQSGNRGGPAGN